MATETKKEGWIKKMMTPPERARPADDVFLKILERINKQQNASKRQRIAIAAAIFLALCTNIYIISNQNANARTPEQTEIYADLISNFNIYEL